MTPILVKRNRRKGLRVFSLARGGSEVKSLRTTDLGEGISELMP
jgi:hypothetical protein